MSDKQYVFFFGESERSDKALLGGKGAGLNEMTRIGIPVPSGFTISTEACNAFNELGKRFPKGLTAQVETSLKRLEEKAGKEFGSSEKPLLVSVRSGAKISMPGMMDTVLNLGLNEESIHGIIKQIGNRRFAYDAYRRFIQMFGNVVLGIPSNRFEQVLEDVKEKRRVRLDTELTAEDLEEVATSFKEIVKEETGEFFPEEPMKQLYMAIEAVFNSWNNERAIVYRRLHNIPSNLGTAVNVQTMVFGNMGADSGTGVGFTRNPSTGEKEFYGEYLMNAQGEDVVAGIRTPKHIGDLKKEMPDVYEKLTRIYEKLEKHYRDMQDIEFTIEKGRLCLLQTRTGKRTAAAAVRIATEMVSEGLISKEEAVMRIEPERLDQLLHKTIEPSAKYDVIARGLPASPGAAEGEAVFTSDKAEELGKEGKKVILVRTETSPEDIHGMAAAQGILTARGGMTSHAAVVARGMGKCCIAGCEDIRVNEAKGHFSAGERVVKEGELITLNGSTGEVILGGVRLVEPELKGDLQTILSWADGIRSLGVRANADIPRDAKAAKRFGAEGIGLCRTEHMFFEEDRLPIVREMILADTEAARRTALDKLLPMQKADFIGLFKEMQGLPVTIRLLDPPLHEFLPKREELMVEVALLKAKRGGKDLKEKECLLARVEDLHEFNPMLGFRGCRLGIVYPEISEMQARAIFEAACELKKQGLDVKPEVMIPVVQSDHEVKLAKEIVDKVASDVMKKYGVKLKYAVGTMIELPRACVTADRIAEHAEFFSFGTNDLTQTTLGFSRDDAGRFIRHYLDKGLLEKDPFAVLDQDGVGRLVRIAVKKGRKTRQNLKIGICGEHGGEPSSVEFCHRTGLDYVSCSPYRVPIARLAAAQAKLKES
ncbi:TPA: pyruvate, phosphate dikinase [Candidatus Woesearchaeota archaeon]|nr:pyruvate, phosphate dikinase [Candidatus Woesearchaeota archaeon]